MSELENGATFRELAIRLEGKIDALTAKVDGKFDAVMAKIEAGDRESLNLYRLQESELAHLRHATDDNSKRIANVAQESETAINLLAEKVADFPTVRRLVYSAVGLILMLVITALVALVIRT